MKYILMRVRTHIIYIYIWEERGRRNFCAKMSISRIIKIIT